VTTFRRRVELRGGPLLVLLARLPRIVPFLLVFALLVAGLLIRGAVGAAMVGGVALLLGLLLYLGWPALTAQARIIRALVLLLVIVRAVTLLL